MDEICLDASKAGMEARPMLLRCDEIFKASSIAMGHGDVSLHRRYA